jgi:hypothetical protein
MRAIRRWLPLSGRTVARTAAAVIVLAIAVTGCGVGARPQSAAGSQAASSVKAVSLTRLAGRLRCHAAVTRRYPTDDSWVGIRVRTVRHARIRVVAHYRTVSHMKRARASARGRRTVWYWTSGATLDYRVQVTDRVSKKGHKGWCSIWFTPRAGPVGPSPSPTAPSTPSPSPSAKPTHTSPPTSGAWCTATATVYDASRDWNDVYVNSNQPDTSVTASADGYSHTWVTDSSGYADVYLDGPPPGVLITVTVGGATCTTSD